MSKKIKKHGMRALLAALAVGLFTLTALAFSARPDPRDTPREIVLVARDVAFDLPGRPGEVNPTIRLNKGEPVRLILRNEEPGRVLHCFTISGLNVKTSRDLAKGESEVLTFTPRVRGTFAYACLMHPMMVGKVVVE